MQTQTLTTQQTKRRQVEIVYRRPIQISKHPKQRQIIDALERFVVVEASTKSGKTTGCIVWLFEQALKGKSGDNCWWVAPIADQAKIAYKRLKRFLRRSFFLFEDNKTDRLITLPNGVIIQFKSGDNPDSLFGDDVIAAVIDEATRCTEEVWSAIRSTLTFTKGKCRIIGNVKGNKNWAYMLARKAEAKELPGWLYIKITADDAIEAKVLEAEEIKEAERTLPLGTFLELYYCIPNKKAADRFCFSFDEEKHLGEPEADMNYPLYLSFDFNVNPICCSVIQHYDDTIFVPEVIKLENSNIYSLCDHIKIKYPDFLYIITGDASGRSRSAMVRDNLNYYKIIQLELNVGSAQVKVPMTNPSIEDNQVLVNSIFEHYTVKFHRDKSGGLIYDCKFVEMRADGTIKKGNRDDPTQQADALDTWRYWLNVFMKWFIQGRRAA